MKIKTIVVEDRQDEMALLLYVLKNHFPEIEVVAAEKTISKAKVAIKNISFDLLLTDIEIGNDSAFDLIKLLSEKQYVIFITGYDSYANRALEVSSISFIIKPLGNNAIERLKIGVSRISQLLKRNELGYLDLFKNSMFYVHFIAQQTYSLTNFKVETEGLYKEKISVQLFPKFKDIIYIKSDNVYSTVYFTEEFAKSNEGITNSLLSAGKNQGKLPAKGKGSYYVRISKPLIKVEEEISNSIFIRVDNSTIVNKIHVKALTTRDEVLLSENIKITITPNARKLLQQITNDTTT